nr:MarR family transcriptional regulator [uncultured Anaerostipes sp.]
MKHTDDELAELFFSAARISQYLSSKKKGLSFLHMGQYRCLFYLEEHGSVKQKEMAEELGIRPASLSELISKLEQKGLVKKEPSPKDRRSMMVSLTREGMMTARHGRAGQSRFHSLIFEPLSEEEKETLYELLWKVKEYHERRKDHDQSTKNADFH